VILISSLNRRRLNPKPLRRIPFAAIMFFAVFYTGMAYAAPYDYIVSVQLEQYQIELGQKPVVFGTVLNQALKPVSGAEVKVTFGTNSATTTTNSTGNFRLEFSEQAIPGSFAVNVFAKQGAKKGFGDATITISKQTTTFGDMYYNSNMVNFTNQKESDPYQSLKIKNYEKYLKEKDKAYQKQLDIEAEKMRLQERKEIANQHLNQTIYERKPGPGSFSGKPYDRYIAGLHPSIRDDIAHQINYTNRIVDDARAAMKGILDNGGTLHEAKKAYMEKLSIKRETLEKMSDLNGTENHSKIKKHADSSKVKGLTAKKKYK